MLVRTIGGDAVKVTVLAPPDRDPHFLQAKPSMMIALRNADLLVSVGAELEQGWLPAALSGASNPKILVGQPGYFEACAQVPLIDKADAADRSRGRRPPDGEPARLPRPRADGRDRPGPRRPPRALSTPAGEARFRASAEQFAKAAAERVAQWKKSAAGAPGVVLYHKDANYLLALLGAPILGYVEPLPGIPPSADHLSGLVGQLKGKRGVILYTDYQSAQGPDFLARNARLAEGPAGAGSPARAATPRPTST